MENYIGPESVPDLPINMTSEQALELLIPKGFSHIVNVSIDVDSLVMQFVHAEDHNTEIKIPQKIYNPSEVNVIFPIFVLQVSSFSSTKVDYFSGAYAKCMLNQNQLLWLVLQHRFTMFARNKVHYSDLAKKDISYISEYGEYASYSSVNSIRKSQNYITILDVWEKSESNSNMLSWKTTLDKNGDLKQLPLGEMVKVPELDKQKLHSLFRDLPIQPASESMASESCKFVMYDHSKSFYKAVGYSGFMKISNDLKAQQEYESQVYGNSNLPVDGHYSVIRSIFPTKANVPSRFKSHIVADAYKFSRPSNPIFQEDIVDDKNLSTDGTMMDAIVIFDDIDPESGRLLCGEIEASSKFSSSIVHKEETIRGVFKEIHVSVGETLLGGKVSIGIDDEDNHKVLIGFRSVEIISIEENGINGAYKIVARCTRQIGSSRIFSHTGLKGVTKPKPFLGKIEVNLPDGSKVKRNVDLVTGMNAVKGKGNTIALAQAALMYRLNQCGELPFLSSMNEDQINYHSASLGKVKWTNQNGVEKEVFAGLIQVSVNEMSYMFNNVKLQSFMPESGRYLCHGGHYDLFNHIWETGVDPDTKEVILDLQKCMIDKVGYYAEKDNLPVFSPNALLDLGIFDSSDIKKERRPHYPHVSKILDESYNKGFYLDLKYRGGDIVRFPSAKTINFFVERLASGEWIYPQLLVDVSRCIEACIIVQSNGYTDVGFLNDRKGDPVTGRKRKFLVDRYIDRVKGILYKDQNLGSALLKPRILGVGMKQMTDALVPKGTMVIMDNYTHNRLRTEAGYLNPDLTEGEEIEYPEYFRALAVRNPVVWKSQVQSPKIWSKEQFSKHLELTHGIDLKDYLMSKYCKEILLMNPEDAILQQSDVDGDLMPIFVPKGLDAQKLMENFKPVEGFLDIETVDGVLPQEIQWIKDYREGEVEANDDLNVDNGYKLYDLPLVYSPTNGPTFANFFIDSIVAKGDVGLSTHSNWTLQTLAEIYKQECDAGKVIDPNNPFNGNTLSITQDEINEICYVYSRLVQDFVIRGIKHNDGGSDGFKRFLLANMITSQYRDKVMKFFRDKLGLNPKVINQFFAMIAWGEATEVTQSIMQFISLHNKGKESKSLPNLDNFDLIVKRTFYGRLVSDLYEIRNEVERAVEEGFVYSGPTVNTNGGNASANVAGAFAPVSENTVMEMFAW